jgi:hypothetical protein
MLMHVALLSGCILWYATVLGVLCQIVESAPDNALRQTWQPLHNTNAACMLCPRVCAGLPPGRSGHHHAAAHLPGLWIKAGPCKQGRSQTRGQSAVYVQ